MELENERPATVNVDVDTDLETDLQRQLISAQDTIRRLRRYIPQSVAEGILHDQDRLRGERREVAVMFVDAVGSTQLSASLDAEQVFNLINDLLSRLVACVDRYDGLVDKFTGDGLMAVFGAPIAHENDVELALRAALDMQKSAAEFEPIATAQLGTPLQIRIGIHSGPVIAGIIGAQHQAAYTVIGETVNLAARLESRARPGNILVSSQVYQQTRAFFNFRPRGLAQIKGIREPVAIYEVVGGRSNPLPTRGVTGGSTVLLGRDAELIQLCLLFDAFLHDQNGRLLTIQGEAGIGKSRLVSEALSSVTPDRVRILSGRGLPYMQGVGYSVFRSLLQNARSSDADQDSPAVQLSPGLYLFFKQMLGWRLDPEEAVVLENMDPERIKLLTALAFREWLLDKAQQQPLILVLEDFHWADDLSRELLHNLIKWIPEAPILLCVITRPQPEFPLDASILSWSESLSARMSLHLDLQPLSEEHSRALLGHLVDLRGLPEELITTIQSRAEGNPLYIEEFVRMMIEKEILVWDEEWWRVTSSVVLQKLEIPTSLRGLLLARIDRLPDELQEVLRIASVIGLEFAADLLEVVDHRVHGSGSVLPFLDRLVNLGVLVKRSEVEEQVYAFRHILTQEAVYSSLLHSQRPELHRIVAESIESVYGDDLSRHIEVLAQHYDRAREREKAMSYALSSGDRARTRFANREAIEYYSRALQLSQHLSNCANERWQAVVGLGLVHQHIGEYEEAIACYQAALDEGDDASPQARCEVKLRLGQVWGKRGDLPKAEIWLHEAMSQLDNCRVGAPAKLQAEIHSELGWLALRQGHLSVAQQQLEHALKFVRDKDHYETLSSLLNRLGAVHHKRGEWDRAADYIEEALQLGDQSGDLVSYARSLNNLGMLKWYSGDWACALDDCVQAVELYERIGDAEGLALACTSLGLLYTDRGEWEKAEANLSRSFDIAQRIAHPYELAQAHLNLGRLYLLQRRWELCTQHLNAAVALYVEAGAGVNLTLSNAYYLQGVLSLERDDLEAAEEWAERARMLLEENHGAGESIELGQYERLVGRIFQVRQDMTAARRHFRRSVVILEQSGSLVEVARTTYWLGMLWLEQGQATRARQELLKARAIFERLGATSDLIRLEPQLEQLADLASG